jgi:hypothetical protein
LEALGIEFLNHSRPGVRLSTPTERTSSPGRDERAVVKRGFKKSR